LDGFAVPTPAQVTQAVGRLSSIDLFEKGEYFMSDIQSLIKTLQSNNADKRYDACEELRVSPSLPPEALEALRLVTNDANPDVADAAKRAIKVHSANKISAQIVNVDTENKSREVGPEGIITILGSAVITNFIFVILIRGFDSGEIWARFIIGAIPSVVFSMVGYSLWLRSWRTREVEWELKSTFFNLIVVGFFAGLLPSFCAATMSS